MQLAFSEVLNGKHSNFLQKIWNSLELTIEEQNIYSQAYFNQFGKFWDECGNEAIKPKLHTMRRDESCRWRDGISIHPIIHPRSPERFQFAPELKCHSIQKISIIRGISDQIYIDGKWLHPFNWNTLAINDGFESIYYFFQYFNKSETLTLINWTEMKY